jgi:phenylacetic acid degradation operon negative regulatory protein
VTQPRNASRGLTARSIVASTLLGTNPPRLPARVLVRAGELFGISEGTTRVALSRMVANGELATDGGWYELAGRPLLARQARQEASRAASTRGWDGSWVLMVVTADRRTAAARAELRDALRRARLAELREGVWLRPDNLELALPAIVHEQATTMRATDVTPTISAELWDLAAWQSTARKLRTAMKPLVTRLERGDVESLADGFVTSAAVLRHFQADPLLPEELLPGRWPGRPLRDDYDRFDRAYRAVLRSWFRANSSS